MDFTQAIKYGFTNYVNFKGRAIRSEFWYWNLFVFLVGIGAQIIDFAFLGNDSVSTPLSDLWELFTFLPALAFIVRRLHDTDHSGWWVLLLLVPLIGFIVLLVWCCRRGTVGPNRFGPDYFQSVASQPQAA
jgi:uncharacterized membrane protein YhaH (DUF805 family)